MASSSIKDILEESPFSWTWEIVGPVGFGDPRWRVEIQGVADNPIVAKHDDPTEACRMARDAAERADRAAQPTPEAKR